MQTNGVRILALVSITFFLLQCALVSPRLYLGWDEALYASQFGTGVTPYPMGAPRAWGIPLIAAPVTVVTSSVPLLRLYFAGLSSIGMFTAWLPWQRSRPGLAVPFAAGLFGGLWLTLLYAGEVMPNVLVAEGAVFAAGAYSLRGRRYSAGLVLVLGVVSLIRPTDALLIAGPLLLSGLLVRSWRRPLPALAVIVGLAIGWIPFAVEAQLRFGGLAARMDQINAINGTGFQFSTVVALRNLQALGSGTLICFSQESTCGSPSVGAVVFWTLLAVLAALGLSVRRFPPQLVLAVAIAVSAGLPYLTIVRQVNPRYLLTTYALLAIPTAEALCWVMSRRGRRARAAAVSFVTALTAAHLTYQIAMVRSVAAEQYAQQNGILQAATTLSRVGIRQPCVVTGQQGPGFTYATRCRGPWDFAELAGRTPVDQRCGLEHLAALGWRVAIVQHATHPHGFGGWQRIPVGPPHVWYAHLPPSHPTRACQTQSSPPCAAATSAHYACSASPTSPQPPR